MNETYEKEAKKSPKFAPDKNMYLPIFGVNLKVTIFYINLPIPF